MLTIFKSFKNLNESTLKSFISIVELVNYSNIIKQIGNSTTRKTAEVVNKYGSKFKFLNETVKEPMEESITTKTEELMLELNKLKKSKLIVRLITSIETRLEQEKSLSQEQFSPALIEEAMINSAAKKYKINASKSNKEKIQIIKVSVEKELKELNTKYREMKPEQEREMEAALKKDIENLSDKERDDLKNHLDIDSLSGGAVKEVLTKSGGAISLMMIPSLAGFSSYVALTTIMHAIFTTTLGITLPFAAYTSATSFVSILSGPIGWIGMSGLTLLTLNKNRKKLTQTIMAQIVGITALISETEEDYLSALPDWLSTAQKKNLVDLKEKLDVEKNKVAKLISEKEELENEHEEASVHIQSLRGEINTLNTVINDHKQENEDRNRLTSILKEKKKKLEAYENSAKRAKKFVKEIEISNVNIKGYVELICQSLMAENPNDKKGLQGETQVFTKLLESMPGGNTYVLNQPLIGEKSPDILVIHPDNGFRIIEVKNFSLYTIVSVESNGTMEIKRRGKINKANPLDQVESHVYQLYTYLKNNHRDLDDQYRNIGYCVAQMGFTKKEFIEKFGSTINQWTPKSQKDFFKYHIFADQIHSEELSDAVWEARKFNDNFEPLTIQKINDIATSTNVNPYFK